MANEEKRDSAPLAQTTNGYRIAVNVITLIVVIIASFAAGFAVSALVQNGKEKQNQRPDFSQMPQMNGNQNQNWPNRPQRNTQPDSSSNNS